MTILRRIHPFTQADVPDQRAGALAGVTRVTIEADGLDVVEVDATMSEAHASEAEATDHPVEQGYNITDHVRPKPQTLVVEGLISNTPIKGSKERKGVNYPRNEAARSEKAHFVLTQIIAKGKLCTVKTKLQIYRNMVMVSLSSPRDSKLGDAVKFSASFKEIRVVSTQLAESRAEPPLANKKKPVQKEKVVTKEAPKAEVDQSWAAKGGDALFGDSFKNFRLSQ